jgi:hypothetical protein
VILRRLSAVWHWGLGMACPGCKSPNTEKLSHYWESLPAESPLKDRYAPPAVVQARVLAVLGVVGAGIWITFSGAILWGLAIVVGGLVWGARMMAVAVASQADRDQWAASQLCLSCTERWQP